ncbi:MAG: hypothetical protein HQ472_05390 [Ignavibacteria bacterium]|nr:hypothetical protein [Ignavibacteria bacterium]
MTILELVCAGYENWNDAAILFETGHELEERSRFSLSEKFLRRSIELDPAGNPGAYIALAFALFRGSTSNDDDEPLEIMRSGMKATNSPLQHAWTHAIEPDQDLHFPKIEALFNATSDLNERLCIANSSMWGQHTSLAEVAVAEAHKTVGSSTDPEAIASYIYMMLNLNRMEKLVAKNYSVAEAIQQLVKVAPDNFATYSAWNGYCRLLEDWEGALQATSAGLKSIPDEETIMLMAANAYMQLDNNVEAEKHLLMAMGAKPSFIGARLTLARLYDKLGRTEEAVALARTFLIVNPSYKWGQILGAALLWKNGHKDEAANIVAEAQSGIPEWAQQSMNSNVILQEIVQYIKTISN